MELWDKGRLARTFEPLAPRIEPARKLERYEGSARVFQNS